MRSSLLFFVLITSCGGPEPATPAAGGTAPTDAPAVATKHTCPMHPEIVQDGPGSCPRCGMPLVPAEAK